MHRYLVGTVVAAVQELSAVYIGVDSKSIAVGPDVIGGPPQLKIHRQDDVVFAHVGLFKGEKIDVAETAKASITEAGTLDQIVGAFTSRIEPQLVASLTDLRRQSSEIFQRCLQAPLQVFFGIVRNGRSQTRVIRFTVINPTASGIELGQSLLRCPGNCPRLPATLTLGEDVVAQEFLRNCNLEVLGSTTAIRMAIERQADATPEYVSRPVRVMWIDSDGVHSDQNGS